MITDQQYLLHGALRVQLEYGTGLYLVGKYFNGGPGNRILYVTPAEALTHQNNETQLLPWATKVRKKSGHLPPL